MPSIYLTEEQRQVVKAEQGRPIGVIDPATGKSYVLIGREQFEPVRKLIGEPAENSVPAPEHDISVPPGIRCAQESYWRDLPELLTLKTPERQWVAYHGSNRVAFARASAELYQECVHRRGLKKDEIYIGWSRAPCHPGKRRRSRHRSPTAKRHSNRLLTPLHE